MSDAFDTIRLIGSAKNSHEARKKLPSAPLALALLASGVGEALLYAGYPRWALWVYVPTLVGCLLAGRRVERDRVALHAVMLVPLFRLVNLGMPRIVGPTLGWLPLVYLAMVPGLYYALRTPGLPTPRAGVRTALWGLPLAVLLGIVLGEIEGLLVAPGPLVAAGTLERLALLAVVMVAVVAPVEELLFRGILQQALETRFGTASGLVIAAFLYGMMHAGHHAAAELLFAFGVALLLGVLYDRTRSLALTVVVHGAMNVYLYGVRPVYGLSLFG